jgi:hypothetical protein
VQVLCGRAVGIIAALIAASAGVSADARQLLGAPLDGREPIGVFIATGDARTGFRQTDRDLARWAFEAWMRTAGTGLRLVHRTEAEALVRLYWAGPNDGQYGEMRSVMVGGRRGAEVFVRPDMSGLGDDIAARAARDPLLRETIVYLTCLHELGHAFGLVHTRNFDDVMYFFGYGGDLIEYFGRYRGRIGSRTDIAATTGLSPSDERAIRSLYPSPSRP